MKSIQEKAEEYATENINSMGYKSQEHFDGFKAGANYVLDAIEEFLNFYGVCCINSSAKTYLKEMIEQLKK